MSAQLDRLMHDFVDGHVPERWQRRSYPSLKPLGSWGRDLVARLAFFGTWLKRGTPVEFWLPAFFQPHAFLTATLQNHARHTGTPIDALRFEHRVLSLRMAADRPPPDVGAHVYGLYLECASWDETKGVIAEPRPKQLYAEMPVIHLRPTTELSPDDTASRHAATLPGAGVPGAASGAPPGAPIATGGGHFYACPIYRTTARGGGSAGDGMGGAASLICYVRLPTEANDKHWIKRSAALVCSLDD